MKPSQETTEDAKQEALRLSQIEIEGDRKGYYAGEPTVEALSQNANEFALARALMEAWHGMVLPNEEDVVVGAPQCQRCEVLPRPMTEAGTLVLRFLHTFTLGKVLQFLDGSQWKHSHRAGLGFRRSTFWSHCSQITSKLTWNSCATWTKTRPKPSS